MNVRVLQYNMCQYQVPVCVTKKKWTHPEVRVHDDVHLDHVSALERVQHFPLPVRGAVRVRAFVLVLGGGNTKNERPNEHTKRDKNGKKDTETTKKTKENNKENIFRFCQEIENLNSKFTRRLTRREHIIVYHPGEQTLSFTVGSHATRTYTATWYARTTCCCSCKEIEESPMLNLEAQGVVFI